MYQKLSDVQLKSGECVEAGVVLGPDEAWRDRVQQLLLHKGDIWNWQNSEMLREPLGLEARFHILHRDGAPFSHVLVSEVNGVALLGHVWTKPEERGNGAASRLMEIVTQHFRERGGKALYLSTGYDTSPFHIYRKFGFEGIEPASGVMHFFATSREQFEAEYFAPGDVITEPLDWSHWPVAPALFCGDWPQAVRSTPLRLFGRSLTEGPLLPPLRAHRQPEYSAPQVCVLRKTNNGAIVGLAASRPDPLWPDAILADIFCHPHFWPHAGELWRSLKLPQDKSVVAYSDDGDKCKAGVLRVAGFTPVATLPQWIAADAARTRPVDVKVWKRS